MKLAARIVLGVCFFVDLISLERRGGGRSVIHMLCGRILDSKRLRVTGDGNAYSGRRGRTKGEGRMRMDVDVYISFGR